MMKAFLYMYYFVASCLQPEHKQAATLKQQAKRMRKVTNPVDMAKIMRVSLLLAFSMVFRLLP